LPLGAGDDPRSKFNGNSGVPVQCGVVAIAAPSSQNDALASLATALTTEKNVS